jgi:translation initiation factor eIF-2B subunit alpha
MRDRIDIADAKLVTHSAIQDLGGRTKISLGSGCDLFMKYVTRAFNMEYMEFGKCKEEILKRGEKIAGISLTSREHIAKVGHSFVEDGCTVLVHGHSRVVVSLLLKASESKQFNILVTEGRPNSSDGAGAAQIFAKAGIPTTVISDNAVGHMMDRVDLCIVGAEGVMENGGIVNKVSNMPVEPLSFTVL